MVHFGYRTIAGQFTGSPSSLERAGENLGEGQAFEPVAQAPGVALPALGQRQVRQARMLACHAPRRLAMAGEKNDG
jgi:hypothetical protein